MPSPVTRPDFRASPLLPLRLPVLIYSFICLVCLKHMAHEENKHNVMFFEARSMKELYQDVETWQTHNKKRFLSLNVQHDQGLFCCIALTNPTEVVIVGRYVGDGLPH